MQKVIKWDRFEFPNPFAKPSENDEDEAEFSENKQQVPMMIPMMGMEFQSILHDRELFIANINFPITLQHITDLDEVEGLEGLHVVSKYCFIIAVGELFDGPSVVNTVSEVLGIEYPKERVDISKEANNKITEKVLEAKEKGEFWAMYIFPNEEIYVQHYETLENLEDGKREFEKLHELSEGVILYSNDN